MAERENMMLNATQRAAVFFHRANPNATDKEATEAAELEFVTTADQREFVAHWKKLHEQAVSVRQIQFTSDVNRIWPEDKGY